MRHHKKNDPKAPAIIIADISIAANLRRHISRAATSLQVIGFLSASYVLVYMSGTAGFAASLLTAMFIQGLANSTASHLLLGSWYAGIWAGAWSSVWLAVCVFDAWPKAFRGDFSASALIGGVIFVLPLLCIARGLLHRFHFHRLRSPDRSWALTAHPWESLRVRVRPRFLELTGAGVVLLLLAPLPWLIIWAANLAREPEFAGSAAEQLGVYTGGAMVTFLVGSWGARIYRRARRRSMLPGSELVKQDIRRIVLYLRSFADDSAIRVWARATNGRILPERLLRVSFEEVVTDHLWGFGPVLAIGKPEEQDEIAPLGAARDFASNEDWQSRVTDQMAQASLVVAIVGGTSGLAWEIDAVAKLGFLSKLVLVFPPVPPLELTSRWQFLLDHTHEVRLPRELDVAGTRAIIFLGGNPVVISGAERDDWTYEAALDQAALVILGTPKPTRSQSGGASWQRVQQELRVFARGAVAFLALGGTAMVLFGISEGKNELSHPFVHPGSERNAFVAELTAQCRAQHAESNDVESTRYCDCYANKIANAITYRELKVLGAEQGLLTGKADDVRAAFLDKARQASQACPSPSNRDK